MTTHKQPEGQDRNVFNTFKRALKSLPLFTDKQLASLGFEVWNEAYTRSDNHKAKQ